MKTFADYAARRLAEAFDGPPAGPGDSMGPLTANLPRGYVARFTIGGQTMVYFADDVGDGVYEISFKDGQTLFDLTGRGQALRVFKAVADYTRQFIAQVPAQGLRFLSNKSDTNRLQAYLRIARHLAPSLGFASEPKVDSNGRFWSVSVGHTTHDPDQGAGVDKGQGR